MKKLILAVVLSLFGVSAAHACDGMKGHEKAEKSGAASTQAQKDAKQDSKTKADNKS
jgi:hypothetical protein